MPIHSEVPRASAAHPIHSAASCHADRRRQLATRPSSASTVSVVPNIGMPSLSRPCRNGLASGSSSNVVTRGVGVNIPGRPMPYCLYDTASLSGGIDRPPCEATIS